MDSSVDAEFNVTISSIGSSLLTSTPKTSRKRPAFRKPEGPAPKRPAGQVYAVCSDCNKVYMTKRYYENHMRSHKLKRAAVRYPNRSKMLKAKIILAREVLKKMEKTAPVGKWGPLRCALICDILSSVDDYKWNFLIESIHLKFVNVLQYKQFCLPSALYQCIQKIIEDLLTAIDFRNNLLSDLKNVYPAAEYQVFNTFLVEYVFKLGDQILHFISWSIIDDSGKGLRMVISVSDKERQLIHYVSGAVIRGFLRKAWQYRSNNGWVRVRKAILNCILEGEVVVAAAQSDRYWTEFCNRGALCFVGKSLMEFMMCVVQLLCALERPDGSLLHEEVQEKLLECDARLAWDKMIGNCLREDESISFMRGVVRSFTCTYGKGISLKHMNRVMEKPKVSMPLRKRLGAKSAG